MPDENRAELEQFAVKHCRPGLQINALKIKEHPSISLPGMATEDGKGGNTWQELPE